jgi:tetratricopeptide (TPR) repeat protein
VAENPRVEELRRRVERDPASIAFAQLAEEYRRAGDYREAVRVCRTGLAQHPTYLSARVTLGRALLELEQLDEAQSELDDVLHAAPDNLAAIRALAEIHQRRGDLDEASKQSTTAHGIARDEMVPPIPVPPPDFNGAGEALDALALDRPVQSSEPGPIPDLTGILPRRDPVLDELEWWLEAILADRHARR